MRKKEVLGFVLAGMLNFVLYDVYAKDFEKIGGVYNSIHCKLNPGRKESERKIKVTLAVDKDLVAKHGEKEIFNTLENILASVSERAKWDFGISFEVKDKFVYDARKKIYGYERVEEASLKVPKMENELRLIFTERPITYYKQPSGNYTAAVGIAPINQNICLIYFDENIPKLTDTTLHEILHSFGAEHVADKASLMYPYTNDEPKIVDSTTLETVLHYKNKKFF
ncbi:MAG: matrixin family metalloprotease [Nanoarchaeota archaeon]